MLALAHKIQNAIDRGIVKDRAEVARKLGLTRARVTQLLDLTLLAPGIQEQLLFLESMDGLEPMRECVLRAVVNTVVWAEQRVEWSQIVRPRLYGLPSGVDDNRRSRII
jgi:hypothetical protein